jgi:transcriptional regulator with XRE-family HTH domain
MVFPDNKIQNMEDRFKLLLEQLRLSPSEFADKIGIQRSSVSHIFSGRNKPSIDFLEKILNVFPEIDVTWLITGRISSQKDVINVNPDTVKEGTQPLNAPGINEEPVKLQVPGEEEPVEHIIVVFKNDTFRILKPSGK